MIHLIYQFIITVQSFTEMIGILLSGTDDHKFVLTDRFDQDPVEIYFGQQKS